MVNNEKLLTLSPTLTLIITKDGNNWRGKMKKVRFNLNGEYVEVKVDDGELLLDTLRDRLKVKSVKHGCGIGECGTCTVLINNEPVYSCLTLTESIEGRSITTVEGIKFNELKESFLKTGAIQCGFCTPGMILVASSLLNKKKNLSKEEIKLAISGNLCRCTGYNQIVEAIENVCKN